MVPRLPARLALVGLLQALALACARPGGTHRPPPTAGPAKGGIEEQAPAAQGAPPLHLSALTQEGDPARRASMGFVLEGLDADGAGSPDQAANLYERALQVDPSNPYAYLALARQRAEGPEPAHALPYLEKARALFAAQKADTPSVQAHLCGLRALALEAAGRSEDAKEQMARAKALAPDAWGDGRLDAAELR
jgi:tetratricopeptide (TPR) repeat protein